MSIRKIDKSNYVIGTTVASKKGASLLVERVQLTQAGFSALTTTAKSIGNGNQQAAQQHPTSGDYALGYAEGFNDACKPAQRTWVGLTDEEIEQGCKESWVTEQAWQSAVWWAETKLRERNT